MQNLDRRRPRCPRWTCAAALAAIVALGAALVPATALADGDPASDVLVSQSVFVPPDAGVSQAQQAQLQGLLRRAAAVGSPVRVALIASATDLGSVTALWRQPESYARYLGDELSLVYHGRVLVVMPDGIGLYGATASAEGVAAAHAGFAGVAERAVQRLAAAAGHPLTLPRAITGRVARPAHDPAPWVVFIIGCWLIVLAWTASIRARPLHLRLSARR